MSGRGKLEHFQGTNEQKIVQTDKLGLEGALVGAEI